MARALHFQEQLVASLCRAAGAALAKGGAGAAPRGPRGDAKPHADAEAEAGGADGDDAEEQGTDEEDEFEDVDEEDDEPAGQPTPQQLLASFRTHAAKRMAEMCTAQLQVLLDLGASLAAPARIGR